MKKRRLLEILCLSAVLSACHTYDGYRIPLPYVEEGTLITVKADALYDVVITDAVNTVVLFGDDSCSACQSAKKTFLNFAEKKHTNLYYCDFISASYTSEELSYEQKKIEEIINYDESSTPLSEEMDLPFAYFFLETCAVICVRSGFSYALSSYVTVEDK